MHRKLKALEGAAGVSVLDGAVAVPLAKNKRRFISPFASFVCLR